MITDTKATITYTEGGKTNEIIMTVTGQQTEDTMRRRMKTLMPNARVIDIKQIHDDKQLELDTKKR